MNATQVEALFSGKPVVIKRDIDETTAKKYFAAFKKAGAVCKVSSSKPPAKDSGSGNTSSAPAKPQAASPATAAASASRDRSGRMAGKDFVNLDVPSDLGALSMGNTGEAIPTLASDAAVDIPDTSSLTMSQDESRLAPSNDVPEPDIDIAGLSMED